MRQLATESFVFAFLGGGLGVGVGWALTRLIPVLAPEGFPRVADIQVDAWFLLASVLTTLFVGAAAGVWPAVRQSQIVAASARQVGGPRSAGRLRQGLLVAEAALSVVLLIGSVLLSRSLVALLDVDAGYDSANVVVGTLRAPRTADQRVRNTGLTLDVVDRLRASPGVLAAGAGNMSPFGFSVNSMGFRLPGVTGRDGAPLPLQALLNVVTPGYAEAMGLRLVDGRFFTDRDRSSEVFPFLLNAAFVRNHLDDGRPVVGRRFEGIFPGMLGRADAVGEVVGVVGDVLLGDLDREAQPQLYVPAGQPGVGFRNMTLVVRGAGDPAAMSALVTAAVNDVDPAATVDHLGPLAGRVSTATQEPRFFTFVLSAFGLLALVLATAGLYGVLSYSFSQRRQELGLRAALGATRRDLMGMVVRQGLVPTMIGLSLGVLIAAASSRVLASVLFGVAPLDVVAFSVGPSVFLLVAGAACLVVARRVTSVAPREVLTAE